MPEDRSPVTPEAERAAGDAGATPPATAGQAPPATPPPPAAGPPPAATPPPTAGAPPAAPPGRSRRRWIAAAVAAALVAVAALAAAVRTVAAKPSKVRSKVTTWESCTPRAPSAERSARDSSLSEAT